jgi:hypothetical protein
MDNLPIELTKLLFLRFTTLYGEKFARHYVSDEMVRMWWEDWAEGLAGVSAESIKIALMRCRTELEWPPSLAEFRRFCDEASGVPTLDEALAKAIRKDFTHPIISIAYQNVGNWDMSHDKDDVLRPKFARAYQEALALFRVNPEKAQGLLEDHRAKIALPEPPSKVPSHEEILGWRERMAKYQEMAKKDKARLCPQDHPKWDKDAIQVSGRKFDEVIFNERKRYLLGLDEIVAGTLDPSDWYDRITYMREIEAMERIKNNPPRVDTPQDKDRPKRSYGAYRVNKYWD